MFKIIRKKIKFFILRNFSLKFHTFLLTIWNFFKLKDNLVLYKFKNPVIISFNYFNKINFKLKIYPKSNLFQDSYFFINKQKHFEEQLLKVFMFYCLDGNNVIDVGANIGHHSLFLSKCVGKNGKVYCFEPIKSIYERLLNNIELNSMDNINAYNYALGDKVTEQTIFINDKDKGSSSLFSFNSTSKKEIVKIQKLDLLNIENIKFIKIDVEGYEYEVLKGAENLINKYHPIIILEYSPIFYLKINPQIGHQIIQFLLNKNYKIIDASQFPNFSNPINDLNTFISWERKNNFDIYQTDLLFF